MSRSSLLLLAALAATAHADDEPHGQPQAPVAKKLGARGTLAQQLGDEAASIDRALGTVTEKLAAADTARTHRLAAAYRILELPVAGDPMAAARRRTAARLLVGRDLAERGLLADEAGALRAAAARVADDTKLVPEIELPETIGRPVRGTIARKFGTIVHERSKATLSRRGLDFDVADNAEVLAPADGIVRYAGPIRGLDAGVVIDHGSYMTVLGKLGDTIAPVGARVGRGDRVGRALRRRVYLEVRVKVGPGGLPIDPEPLLDRSAPASR